MKTRPEIVTAMQASAISKEFYKERRERMVEYIAEHDDAILDKYLAEHELKPRNCANQFAGPPLR